MNKLTKAAATAISLTALCVDAALIFLVPELRIKQSQATLAQAAGTTPKTTTQSQSGTGESTAGGSISSSGTQSPGGSSSSGASSASTGTFKDGTYTGASVSTNRGDFQIKATVSGGKLTAVNVETYPQDPTSQSINSQAIPVYVSEALKAQSSQITLVSGATETYRGFTGSLQDAINQAKGA